MDFRRMQDVDLRDRRVLIREDLNVPIKNGAISSDTRLEAAWPTIAAAAAAGARVMVASHLGRPKEGAFDASASLAPVAAWLSARAGREIRLVRDWLGGVEVASGEIVLLENVRFNVGEENDDPALAQTMAALCDVFVMDAFGTAHRAQASTHGVIRYARTACAGPLLAAELDALSRALLSPARPLLAIVAGSKVSTKLELLGNLVERVDQLIVGGGIANTFIAAAGYAVGKSLHEPNLLDQARTIVAKATARGASIPLPLDVVAAGAFAADAAHRVCAIDALESDEMILDIGPATAAHYASLVHGAGTVVWNGPVGVFEMDAFGAGTKALAEAIAASSAFSIAGGGDTLAAIEKYGVGDRIGYISTGGGAFLEFLEGKELPAVAALKAVASPG